MMLAQVNSIAFRLFGIPVYWYAIIIVSGIALAVWLSSREAVRVGLKENFNRIVYIVLPLKSDVIQARANNCCR